MNVKNNISKDYLDRTNTFRDKGYPEKLVSEAQSKADEKTRNQLLEPKPPKPTDTEFPLVLVSSNNQILEG